ncbi:carnitine O-acetyltransferase-like [Octopus sinensis]|uniref:Carnitine O-acetyltransferase-like n=1 Tax=Octopus sinensis TaxID=2607531 RepID=A0A7E6EHC7_9MOLL|nr:carnitine O-acetyltransferase-like [Octopus sinensis]
MGQMFYQTLPAYFIRKFDYFFLDSLNVANICTILDCICILCIDTPDINNNKENDTKSTKSSVLAHMLHGHGTHTANRWFDKTLQLVYKLEDGYYGMTYEHTPAEGVALAKLAQFIHDPKTCGPSTKKWRTILIPRFCTFKSTSKTIFRKINNVGCRYLKFDKFGKNLIKSLKISPDAFIQVAFQLAYYRFLAVSGKGTDRHLSALKWIGMENGVTLPSFFENEAFGDYFRFRISTSQVPISGEGVLVFGPACQNGYGICYNPQDEFILFSITTFLLSEITDVDAMCSGLSEALSYQYSLLGSAD